MEKRNKKTKFVTIETNGHISELGGIAGPILHPCLVDLDLVIQMVNNRKKVYEVNPNNPDEKVLLSLRNVRNENFPVYTADKKTTNPAPSISSANTSKKVETTTATDKDNKKSTSTTDTKTSNSGDFSKK